ncbi:hypothetical protein HDU98_009210 [Podochytrium sp. JEL0797]|nr:hypothetical protein HDU98_009210 [Podochytrium sp. JEL0797]
MHSPRQFLASATAALHTLPSIQIQLPEISFDPRETHEAQDPAGVSKIIYERLDQVKERERRSILRFLRKLGVKSLENCIQDYVALSPSESDNVDEPLFSKQIKNIVDPTGLSIIERVFYKSPPNKPQVIMSLALHFTLPNSVTSLKPERIVDLIRIAASKHYRCSSFVDPVSMNAHPLAPTADKLPCNYRFIKSDPNNPNAWQNVYAEEINTNFDLKDWLRPLWRASIIIPESWLPSPTSRVHDEESPLPSVLEFGSSKVRASETGSFGETLPPASSDNSSFKIIFSFHHCLGDGLSMYAFCRTFAECAEASFLKTDDLHLERIVVAQEPPPLLDNVFNPSIFQVLPTAIDMAFRSFIRRNKVKFAPFKEALLSQAPRRQSVLASVQTAPNSPNVPASPNNPHPLRISIPRTPSNNDILLLPDSPSNRLLKSQTNVRFLWFPEEFTVRLRSQARTHGTSIAAVLVVCALTATRAILQSRAEYAESGPPTHQGWVVTNSIRHVLPQSRLMQGGSREDDPALKIFGGFAGSVTNNNLHFTGEKLVWSRCRSVKKTIATCGRVSLARMRLLNYCFRHPKLWRMIERRTDLEKLSRGFSVEVANLGAWKNPFADTNAPGNVEKLSLTHFGGVVNSSFEGVRGLFTLGVITLGGNMSVAVAHDSGCVSEEEAQVFVRVFSDVLQQMNQAGAKATVDDLVVKKDK